MDMLVVYTPEAADEIDTSSPGGLVTTEMHADANIERINQVLEECGLDNDAAFEYFGAYVMDVFDEENWLRSNQHVG